MSPPREDTDPATGTQTKCRGRLSLPGRLRFDAEVSLGGALIEDFPRQLFDLPALAGPEEVSHGAVTGNPAVVVVFLVQRDGRVAADERAEAGDVPDAVAGDEVELVDSCLLYTSDAADERSSVD